MREHVHVTCQGGIASAMVLAYDAKANAALAAALSKAIGADTRRADVVSVTVPGGYATALVYDHTPAEAQTLAALLNAAILRASEAWRPSHPPV
jgi:hypothetical protein